MSLLDTLAAAARRPDALSAVVAVVLTVGPSGRTVDVDVAGAMVPDLPCSAAYPGPAAGDVVLVLKLAATWHVAYALGPARGALRNLANPGFELGRLGDELPTGWESTTFAGGGPCSMVADAHAGSLAWQVTGRAGRDRWAYPVAPIRVLPGETVDVGVWVRCSRDLAPGEFVQLEVWPGQAAEDPGPTRRTVLAVMSTPAGQWRNYTLPFVQGPADSWIKPALSVLGRGSAATGLVVTFDDVTVRSVV